MKNSKIDQIKIAKKEVLNVKKSNTFNISKHPQLSGVRFFHFHIGLGFTLRLWTKIFRY